MSDCATELRSAIAIATGCPGEDATVMFIGPDWYKRYTWPSLLTCITDAVRQQVAPDDEEVIIESGWAGRNYFSKPELTDKRFRLFRDGVLMNLTQYRPLTAGGWELLQEGDILELNQVFTIVIY